MDYRGNGNGTECPQEQPHRILIVDDHPLSCKGYELIIQMGIQKGILPYFDIEIIHSLEAAYRLFIEESFTCDMVLLDICMKPFPEQNLFSGDDLGRWVIEKYPKIKILVMTSLLERHRLGNILKTLNPLGFLIKSEIDELNLVQAVRSVLRGIPFYSATIMEVMRNRFVSDIQLDLEEKTFIWLLSQGTPTKEIPEQLHWSLSKVEKRKRALRKKLGVENNTTMALVKKAKELGII